MLEARKRSQDPPMRVGWRGRKGAGNGCDQEICAEKERESGGMIDFSSVCEGSLDQNRSVAAAHEQTGQLLGMNLEILVPVVQDSNAEEIRIGNGSFV